MEADVCCTLGWLTLLHHYLFNIFVFFGVGTLVLTGIHVWIIERQRIEEMAASKCDDGTEMFDQAVLDSVRSRSLEGHLGRTIVHKLV